MNEEKLEKISEGEDIIDEYLAAPCNEYISERGFLKYIKKNSWAIISDDDLEDLGNLTEEKEILKLTEYLLSDYLSDTEEYMNDEKYEDIDWDDFLDLKYGNLTWEIIEERMG